MKRWAFDTDEMIAERKEATRRKRNAAARARYRLNSKQENVRSKLYCDAHREELRAKSKVYDANPERKARKAELERSPKIKAMRLQYRLKNPRTEYSQAYEQAYRERRKELHEIKQATDVQYRLRRALRARLKQAMKHGWKTGSAIEDLGCSVLALKVYLEAQFLPGMTWDNFGRLDASASTWQIDHYHPLSGFDLTNSRQVREACHFSNLRPMWALDNRRKGNRTMSRKEVSHGLP